MSSLPHDDAAKSDSNFTADYLSRDEKTKTPRSPADLEADVLVGDFRIEKRLGAGGMGIVYKARQVSLNRVVALKILGSSLRTEAGIARFHREAQAIAKLNHPDIAAVHFIGQDDQVCYMAMEYVEGVSLRDLMRRLKASPAGASSVNDVLQATQAEAGASKVLRFDAPSTDESPPPGLNENADPLSPAARQLIQSKEYVRWCAALAQTIAGALAHAHDQGVIHRDVKPENLLINQAGKATVIDFGLARFYEDETITYTGQLVGTPLYMSPEQIMSGGEVDGRTDVYSLGMVLHELLTLEPPLTAPNRESLFRQIVTGTLPPIDWTNPAVPPDLVAIVHHALAKDARERYQSMAEFQADLERFLAGKAVAAPRYYYRFDEREIMAARPADVVVASIFFAFIGLFPLTIGFFGAIFFILMAVFAGPGMGRGEWQAVMILVPIGMIGYLLGMLALSLGAGSQLARKAGLIIGSILILGGIAGGTLFAFLSVEPQSTPSGIVMGFVPLSFGTVFVVTLLRLRVREWFRFAAETRAEFKRRQRRRG